MSARLEEASVESRWSHLDPSTSRLVGPDYFVDAGPFFECASDQLRPIHRHDYFELGWLAEGTAVFYHDFRHVPLEAGALTFVLPRRMHTWIADWQTTRLVLIGIMPELMALVENVSGSGVRLPFNDPSACPFIETSGGHREAIDRAIKLLLWRCRTLRPEDQAILIAYLELILAEARLARRDAQVAARLQPVDAGVALTDTFRLQVEQHLGERLKVKQYAGMLHVSLQYLVRTVKESSGLSPKQIINDRLVLEACHLLAHTLATVEQIAYSLSFSSASQFSRWFRTHEGMLPTEFRKKWASQQVLTITR